MKFWPLVLGFLSFINISFGSGFSIYLENDCLFHKDFYYTHGTKITLDNTDFEYSIGQNMYTAENKKTLIPDVGDRPYAGWLYFGISRTRILHTWTQEMELDTGVVGPLSYAYQTQRFIHESLNLDVPMGWDTQINNEFAFTFFLRHSKSLGEHPEFTIIPYSEIAIGNLVTYLSLGTRFQIGYRVDNTLDNQIALKSITPVTVQTWRKSVFQFYLFTGINGRYVCHNIFLDGNTFQSYPYAVDRVPWVADFEIGFTIHYKLFRLDFTRDFRTKEFETESYSTKGYDSVKLSFLF